MAEIYSRDRIPKDPAVGLVIRHAYLWSREQRSGRRDGVKDRPCVVVINYEPVPGLPGRYVVDVAPITHSVQSEDDGVEIPLSVKRRMGLDEDASWIVTTEVNRFIWPGPDLTPLPGTGLSEKPLWHYGFLAHDVFQKVKAAVLARRALKTLEVVPRSSR